MVTNITTMPKGTGTPLAQTSSSIKSTGALAKLSSEIQLIERITPIKLQGSESISLHGKSAQLIHASDQQGRQFSLLNQGPNFPSTSQQHAQLQRVGNLTANLSIAQNGSQPPLKLDNLPLHSRVINLTVTDSLPAPKGTTGHLVQVHDGKQSFPLLSQHPLSKGESIRAVLDANQELQYLPSKTATNSLQLEALKQSLPKQLTAQEMTQLIKQLQQLGQQAEQLPAQSRQAIQQLLRSLPDLQSLTQSSQGMKQALLTSGIFSESQLLQQGNQLSADLKLNLARLLNTDSANKAVSNQIASPLPVEQIANAIERITTTQLRHFSDAQTAPNFPLYMEMAIQNGAASELVQIQIDQDQQQDQSDTEKERRWLVKLNFDFQETGYFEARTSIQGNKVGIVFAAQNHATAQRLQQQFPELKQSLQSKDIEVERLESFQTQFKQNTLDKLKPKHSLIDIKT
ncbi:flagellar hook-length control protein FliK [Marinomonas epiphytica]